MAQRQQHKVVIKKSDGGIETFPMKEWIRRNPEILPIGVDVNTQTSHELRRFLKNQGWRLDQQSDQVLLIQPTVNGDTGYADEIIGQIPESDIIYNEQVTDIEEITFGLERDLQIALRANIEKLEPGLRIIDEGKERVTEAGRIDITAVDRQGRIVVIELKAGTAKPEVIAQILAYMSTVAEQDQKPVRGILVAGDFHDRVILATRSVMNLQLKRYSFQFTFKDIE